MAVYDDESRVSDDSDNSSAAAELAHKEGLAQPLQNEHADPKEKKSTTESATDNLGKQEASGPFNVGNLPTPSDQVGNGYNDETPRRQRIKGLLNEHRKGMLFGGGISGAIVLVFSIIFLTLIPLKIENMVNNLQSRFFGTTENAIDSETQNLFVHYITDHVMPGYKNCGTTVDRHCSAIIGGNDPVSNLYRSWSNARLENTLADKYGLEFHYDSAGKKWYVKTSGTAGLGDDIGSDGKGLTQVFDRADRGALKLTVGSALENETQWKKVMYRYKVGRLLEEKYGVRRCIAFCGVIDQFAGKATDQALASKLFLVQRVIVPRNQTLGIAIKCLLSACDATKTEPNADPEAPATNGVPESPTETQISAGVRQLALEDGVTDEVAVQAIQDELDAMSKDGFQKYAITKALAPIGLDASADTVTKAIPIVGWINLAAQVVKAGQNVGPDLEKLRYITNAGAAVSTYMMYRTYADEIHTGHVNEKEAGSMTNSLGPGNNGSATDKEVGGTAGAEGTPLYSSIMDNTTSNFGSASLFGDLFGSQALAASTTTAVSSASSSYLCQNDKPVPSGHLICPEESLAGGNYYASAVASLLKQPEFLPLTTLANIWNDTIGKLFGAGTAILGGAMSAFSQANDALCNASHGILSVGPPGYCYAKSIIESGFSTILNGVTQLLIPNPFGSNMSGGRTGDMMILGADVSGNDSAHDTLGGKQLTNQQANAINNEQQAAAKQEFEKQPMFAKIFSTDTSYSLISQVADAVPITDMSSLIEGSITDLLSNPFGKLVASVGSIFSPKTSAATAPADDPFGVAQYGYTASDLSSIGDPETYWNQHNCSDTSQSGQTYQWDNSATTNIDSNTGMPVNTTTNPCLLIQATVGSAGGLFSSSNLSADDLADSGGSQ